ncbi:MAG: pilus assembly protein TadG-related protein [Anaerolineae bacterium]
MREKGMGGESGQILVIVALGMVVLLGFLALAVDVGMGYQGRRNMQNAADAGALAGAQALCRGETEAQAIAAAEAARARNGGSGPAPAIVSSWTVSVTAEMTRGTFFAGVLGVDELPANANAAAQCGCSSGACNLWPVTFDKNTFLNAAGSCPDGPHFVLWEDDSFSCYDPAIHGPYDDKNPDHKKLVDCMGLAPVPVAARAWVDFSAALPSSESDPCDNPGCGESELQDRLVGTDKKTGEDCISYVRLPYCIAGDSGVKSSAWAAVGDEYEDRQDLGEDWVVRIPLYASTGCTMDHDPGNTCGNDRFYIDRLACVRILGSYKLKDPTGKLTNARVIEAEILCPGDPVYEQCLTHCGSLVAPYDGCIHTVGLVE